MTNESQKKKSYETMAICEKYVIIRVEKNFESKEVQSWQMKF